MFNRGFLLCAGLTVSLVSSISASSRLDSCLKLCRESMLTRYDQSLIDGMSVNKMQLVNKKVNITFEGFEIDKLNHQKNVYNGNLNIANMHILSRGKSRSSKSVQMIDAHDVSYDFGVQKKSGIAYGRHKISISDLKLKYQDAKKFDFDGIKINYVLRPLSKTATAVLHFGLKHAGDDLGPLAVDVTAKKINKRALEHLVSVLHIKSQLHQADGKYNSKETLAFKALLARGLDVNFSRINIIHRAGSLSATGKWSFPKLSAKQSAYKWQSFLRLSKLNCNVEVSKKLLSKMVFFAINKQQLHKHTASSKAKKISPEDVNALLALWSKIGLIKAHGDKYIFKVSYYKGNWKINGRKFVSPKTSWLPNKLLG